MHEFVVCPMVPRVKNRKGRHMDDVRYAIRIVVAQYI